MVNKVRDGGWIPIVRQWREGGAQNKEAQHGLFTVFVDNIPSTMDAKALYKLFIKFGIVKDTYIPFKRRRVTNSRFGFVRYNCNIAASVAIQKGNVLLVDDSMLEVKMAAYDRNSRSEQSKRKLQPPRRFSDSINFKGKAAFVDILNQDASNK
ncbi:serine/arginine-rich splicing factor 2-like [Camellia sinensis]|uniref:serine/arginine-rich splicing factor 2-like n=1 Tax=Camellia sinensis TaxID=4442 RepID=UPI001035D85B|nr:serine/arginine-rich splicing factor 2-like [Camellia sinensis]